MTRINLMALCLATSLLNSIIWAEQLVEISFTPEAHTQLITYSWLSEHTIKKAEELNLEKLLSQAIPKIIKLHKKFKIKIHNTREIQKTYFTCMTSELMPFIKLVVSLDDTIDFAQFAAEYYQLQTTINKSAIKLIVPANR